MVKKDKRFLFALLFIVLSAVAARLVVGLLYFNAFDTYWYRDWAIGLQDGFFNVYTRAEEISLDYPPLYLYCLYLTGAAYRLFTIDCSPMMQMFLMKFWPIFFDGLCILLVYKISEKHGNWTALFAAASIAANPSQFFGTAYWGQTDQLLILLLLWSFSLSGERPLLSCIIMAVAGLTKYQALFFTPVLLAFIFRTHGIKKLLYGIVSAASTVVAVFLPFMLGARDPLLFFKVYLGGADTYQYCTFNAYNIYALLGLNGVEDSNPAIGIFTYSNINLIIVLLIIAGTLLMYALGRRVNVYIGGLLIMDAIFVFVTRMHERYLLMAVPFALMAYVTTKNRHFLYQFIGLTFTTLINQAAVLLRVNDGKVFFVPYINFIIDFISICNVILFIYIAYVSINYFRGKECRYDLFKTKKRDFSQRKTANA
ncbi:MAG: hypothetical protein IIX73_01505 [Clostridia bacterium]|nr:hypothetical protein [Clostridia bacterium]